ncbi:hypothetical protein [Haladaptatus cibarius]|uniref:hypothetical protein n=1 Tax=Haladaptatus cibarius TaxID=453847 RepID=UPI000678EE95|nr:hypothetical protein [Haladaptatus cibarius]
MFEVSTKIALITVVAFGITTVVGTAFLTLTEYDNTALLDPKFFVWLLFGFVVMLSASTHERDSEDSEVRSRNE